jgi:hypothetical protein
MNALIDQEDLAEPSRSKWFVTQTRRGGRSYPATWVFQLRWSGWADRALWPELALFAVPIAAALRDRWPPGRRAWAWTEWAGLGLSLVLAGCWWLDRIPLIDRTNPARWANVAVRGLWLIGLGFISWLVVRGCDAVRTRLILRPHPARL